MRIKNIIRGGHFEFSNLSGNRWEWRRGSRNFWNQHTHKTPRAKFHAFMHQYYDIYDHLNWNCDRKRISWRPFWIFKFKREPLEWRRGSRNFWNQHTPKPPWAKFHAFFTKCTGQLQIVTKPLHYIRIFYVILRTTKCLQTMCNDD